jgi:hypothetical protein
MSFKGPNQDLMPIGGEAETDNTELDPTYEDAGYLGTDEDDSEEVRDLGFIIDNHDDRRGTLTENWQRLDDLDTDEPLETNRSGPIPHVVALQERGAPPELFATDYNASHAVAEAQEEDFVATSMLDVDPDLNAGAEDYTSDSLEQIGGGPAATDIYGQVIGVASGLGTSVAQDLGGGGFQIQENPLLDEDLPTPEEALQAAQTDYSDEEETDAAEAGPVITSEADLEAMADFAAREAESRGDVL